MRILKFAKGQPIANLCKDVKQWEFLHTDSGRANCTTTP